jgi:hypothetical protein
MPVEMAAGSRGPCIPDVVILPHNGQQAFKICVDNAA